MLIVKYKIIICLETPMGENLCGYGLSNKFLITKGITNNYIKNGLQKHLLYKRNTINKMERQITNGREYLQSLYLVQDSYITF